MDFELKEEHKMIQEQVRSFAEKEVAPRAHDIDEQAKFPADIVKKLGEMGVKWTVATRKGKIYYNGITI